MVINLADKRMKSDLDELVAHYEAQAATFKQYLQECLLIQDYLGAHDYSRSLNLIKNELQMLHNLKDPLYDEKQRLKNWDKNLDYLTTKFNRTKEYWQKSLEGQRLELEQLIEKEEAQKIVYDSQEIDDTLFDLYERKIKGFKLYLNEEDNFYFDFRLSATNILEILVEATTVISSKYSFYRDNLNKYKKLGFQFNKEETLLTFEYNMNSFKGAVDIKTLLARILFKTYSYRSFDKAFLRINKAETTF